MPGTKNSLSTGHRIGPPPGLWGTLPELKGSLDFVGINYYTTSYMKGLLPVGSRPGNLVSGMGWIYYPGGLNEVLHSIRRVVLFPIIITENGVATTDEKFRIRYIRDHLREVLRAISEGIDIRGYMYWSLTDNFEWQRGYGKRFGLVGIDYTALRREVRESGRWFARTIRDNGFKVTE